MTGVQKVIGLMSGTSLDGVDAALLDTDGQDVVQPGPGLTLPYDRKTRSLLRDALDQARHMTRGGPVPATIAEAEHVLTQAHAEAVRALLQKAGLKPAEVSLIGFHGHPPRPCAVANASGAVERKNKTGSTSPSTPFW